MTTPRPNASTAAEQLAILRAVIAQQPPRNAPEVYDGSEPTEERMTDREADMAADRYYGDAR